MPHEEQLDETNELEEQKHDEQDDAQDDAGDDFDKERALATIRKQRESEKALKERLRELEAKEQERADAEKSEAQKLAEEIEAARKEAREARVESVRSRYGIPDAIPIAGATKDEIEAAAQAIADAIAEVSRRPSDKLPKRPRERFVPGDGDDDEAPFDEAEIAKRVRARLT